MEFELEKEKARMEALHRDIERMSVMAVSDSAPTSSARAPLALWQPSASTHGERPCAELGVGDPSSNGLRASSFMIPPSPSDLLLPLKSARVTPTPLCGKAMAGCGSRSEVAHTGKLIAAGGVAASSGGDVDVQVGDVGEEASSVRMERQVEGVGERAGDALLVRGATQSSSGSAKADGESIAEELMGSDMWMAVRDAFARCPPSTHALLHLLRGRAGGALASVGNFLDSTTAYILSKTWHDLLSTYVFGLHPMPFCSSKFGINSCSAPAPSGIQFSYAFFILLVGTGLRMLAQTDRFKHLPGIDSVPSMVGMCVGWAYGDACLKLLDEMVKCKVCPQVLSCESCMRASLWLTVGQRCGYMRARGYEPHTIKHKTCNACERRPVRMGGRPIQGKRANTSMRACGRRECERQAERRCGPTRGRACVRK